jgi:hypothetical protein
MRDNFIASQKSKEKKTQTIDPDKLSILTEALSEVVKEYLDKKEKVEE